MIQIAIAGGGGIDYIHDVLSIGGASTWFNGADVLYSPELTRHYVGGEVWDEKFVSYRTSMQLASAAYQKVINNHDYRGIHLGIGVTSSMYSFNQRKLRRNEAFITIFDGSRQVTVQLNLKNRFFNTRILQDAKITKVIEKLVKLMYEDKSAFHYFNDGVIWDNTRPTYTRGYVRQCLLTCTDSPIIYSGSFNPCHKGHKEVVDKLIDQFGAYNVKVELPLKSTDKPAILPGEWQHRRANIQEVLQRTIDVLPSMEPSFRAKYQEYNKELNRVTFAVGSDTFARISEEDKKYFANCGNVTFIVAQRPGHDYDFTYHDQKILHPFTFDPKMTGFVKISSTEIRNKQNG